MSKQTCQISNLFRFLLIFLRFANIATPVVEIAYLSKVDS